MIEEIVLEYLEREISLPAFMEFPKKQTGGFIVIEKTASDGLGVRHFDASLAIQSYGDTLHEAATLNERVKSAMLAFAKEKNISKCTLNSDYNFTDSETKRYRYQAVFNVVYYD